MSNRIKELREKIFITQDNFAKFLGMTRQAVSKYETGENFLKPDNLKRLIEDYSVNANWLLSGIGNMMLNDKSNDLETIQELQKENEKLKIENALLKELVNKR